MPVWHSYQMNSNTWEHSLQIPYSFIIFFFKILSKTTALCRESMNFKNTILCVNQFKYTNVSWLQFTLTKKQVPASTEPVSCKGVVLVQLYFPRSFSKLQHRHPRAQYNTFQTWCALRNIISCNIISCKELECRTQQPRTK